MKPVIKFINQIQKITLFALVFLVPLFFLPTTPNMFDPNKLLLIIIATFIILVTWLAKLAINKTLKITLTPFTIPLAAFALIYLISSFVSQPNPTEAFMGRGTIIPLLTILFIIVTSSLKNKKLVTTLLYLTIANAVILSFVAIFQALGGNVSNLLNQLMGTSIPDNIAFSPTGSSLAFITFVFPILLATVTLAIFRKEGLEKIVLFLLTAVMIGALLVTTIFSLPGKDTAPILLPYKASYSIALQTIQQPAKTAFLGWGPEAYINAYTRTRPASLNLQDNWNLRFNSASNELFTVVTTVGILGLAAWILILVTAAKRFSQKTNSNTLKAIKIATITLFFIQLILPANLVLLTTTYLFLILWSLELKSTPDSGVREISPAFLKFGGLIQEGLNALSPKRPKIKSFIPAATAVIVTILAIVFLVFSVKVYSAEISFKNSIDATIANDGASAYNFQRDAVVSNPRVGIYRRTYGITNLAIANSLAAKADLSDQDRTNITQLIQQAIREGKAAVALDPLRTANWETLANIYRNLINIAENSEQWTIAAYIEAIQSDPVNPRLRLELGGVYYNLGQLDQAIRLFQQAAELKPDWANAYFNIAAAHKGKNELRNALSNMQIVTSLVEPDSADYTRAQEELNSLLEALNLETQEEQPESELTVPQPLPTPFKEPITLPEDSAPEIPNATGSATPTP